MANNVKIMGNTVGVPNPRSDWNQTDPTKADYIKNKPNFNEYVDSKLENLREQISDKASVDYVDESVSGTYLDLDNKKAEQSFVENLSADIFDQIEQKVEKVDGKGLSTNDFTNAYKEKVDNDTFDGGGDFYEVECELSLDQICDRYTEDGLYKILYEPSSDDFGTQTIILSVTSAGVYIDDDYWRQINQCKYDGGVIEVRSRNKDGEWSEWTRVSVTSSDVTKAINKAIGDVETALENIIQKYGLGGDAQ